MNNQLFFAWIFIAIVWIGCEKPNTEVSEKEKQVEIIPEQSAQVAAKLELETGVLFDSIAVAGQIAESYALYLPQAYTNDSLWPVLVFFDSHARGIMPLTKYQSLAEAFGIVLVASNNSRNGMEARITKDIGARLLIDIRTKLSLDERRQYLSGFSGGARVALNIAQQQGGIIAGAIGCAAGFQGRNVDAFNYIGLVGMEDFNYHEMKRLDRELDYSGIHHLVDYFKGGHEWPPVSVMGKALQWMRMREMADGRFPRQDIVIQNMLQKFNAQDQQLQQNGNAWLRWRLRQKFISYLEGLTDLKEMKSQMKRLTKHPEMNEELGKQDSDLAREMGMRQEYGQQIAAAPLSYWTRVAGMLRKIGHAGQGEESWMHMRVVNFLSLSAYMQANQALKSGNVLAADRLIKIYALIDPPNSEHAYMEAELWMIKKDESKALQTLAKAFALGFEDKLRLKTDPNFKPLHTNAGFQSLIAK